MYVAVDHWGDVYVTDQGNNRVEEFSNPGLMVGWAGQCTGGPNCVRGWVNVGGTWYVADYSVGFNCRALTCSGLAAGSGDGQFSWPNGIAVYSNGNGIRAMFIAEVYNNRVDYYYQPP